jgi:hypothetical protein
VGALVGWLAVVVVVVVVGLDGAAAGFVAGAGADVAFGCVAHPTANIASTGATVIHVLLFINPPSYFLCAFAPLREKTTSNVCYLRTRVLG